MTSSTSSPSPPPLPPPPAPSPQQNEQQPTFIQQWIQTNEQSLQSSSDAQKEKQLFLEEEFLFPLHIPQSAMCKVTPIISLFENHGISSDVDSQLRTAIDGGSGASNGHNLTHASIAANNNPPAAQTERAAAPMHRTTLDDARQIASLCATYKSKALKNFNEFQYKRSVHLHKMQQQQPQETEPQETNASSTPTSKPSSSPPPYHPDYTPLSIKENRLLSRVHSANYCLCLAQATCPERTQNLVSCWKRMDPRMVEAMEEQDMGEYVCLEEREAVERCVGSGVQRVMKDLLG